MASIFLESAPVPLGLIWVFELGCTGLGLGLGVFGTKSLGPGLDNKLILEREFRSPLGTGAKTKIY